MTFYFTLFEFAERVARMREAQQRCFGVQTQTNLRQAIALEHEVDALIVQMPVGLSDEFRDFCLQVFHMRQAQKRYFKSKVSVALAQAISLESGVDLRLEQYTRMAKELNDGIRRTNDQN